MKKNYLMILLGLLLVAIFAACAPAAETTPAATEEAAGMPAECADEAACAVFAPGEAIKIGVGGPTSGADANFGNDAAQGAQTALNMAGEWEGHAFELVIEDDLGTPEGGAAAAQKIASDPKVVAVVGHSFSGATNAAMPIYEEAMIPMMSPSATRIDLSTLGSTVFNRIVPTDFVQGQQQAEYLYNEIGATTLAIIHDGSPYGQGLAERVQSVFTELGGEVVAFEAITVAENDYSAVLNAISASEPEAVLFGGYSAEAAVLASQREAAGLEVPFMSGDGIYGPQFIELAGDGAEGYYGSNASAPEDSEPKAAFDAQYLEDWEDEAGSLSGYTWTAADAVNAIVAAIAKVAIVMDDGTVYIPRAALVAAVRGTTDFAGISGTATCSDTGECAGGGFTIFQVEDGEWVVKVRN